MKRIITLLLLTLLLMNLAGLSYAQSDKLFDETLEFSILSTIWSPYSTETNLIASIEEATNTKIDIEWAPREDFGTKVNALLATAKLPDVIIGANTLNLLEQGAILQLDAYYTEEYAPNILKTLTDSDYVRLRNVNDGHIYTLVSVFDFPPLASFAVRGDWLEKLGMNEPENWEDWLMYWRAVRDNDMNEDGDSTNEIPIAGSAAPLMNSFGIVQGFASFGNDEAPFCYMPDGSYNLITEHPNYEAYMKAMKELYAEGLLDPEFATRDMSAWYKVIDSGLGGSMWCAAEQAKLSSQVLRQSNPEATIICCPPPKGPLGDQVTPARNKIGPVGVITIAAKDKVGEIVKFFDWLYSDEGAHLMNYGVEGIHHQVIDGQPKLVSPYVDSFVEARGAGLIFQPWPFLWLEDNYMQILLTGKTYDELDDLTKVFYDGLFMNEPYFQGSAPTLVTDAFAEYSADIIPVLREMRANYITGRLTWDEYQSKYEQLKGQGLQEIIDDANEAWKVVGF